MTPIPSWLRTDPFVTHLPDHTIFSPQRRITYQESRPYLLDANGDRYPLADCCQLRWEQLLSGAWLCITESGFTLSLYSQDTPQWGQILVVNDGKRRVGVRLSDATENAAQSFLKAFPGSVIVSED